MPTNSATIWIVVAVAAVAVTTWVVLSVRRGPGGSLVTWLLWLAVRGLCRWKHRPVYRGLEHLPPCSRPGGIIVVSNHTGPIDPLLIQARCRFQIRWMMASNMMLSKLSWLWRQQKIISVDRDGQDLIAAREAIRHVREGGVIGIFPEGGIGRPAGVLRHFADGAGLLVSRTKAPVLLVWVRDTPEAATMREGLLTPSRSKVDFIGLFDLSHEKGAARITATLREKIAAHSGWPVQDEPTGPPERPEGAGAVGDSPHPARQAS